MCYRDVNPNKARIGTTGFSYRDWLGNFYPQFCPQADFLRFYATQFDTVELAETFYRMPTEETIRHWDSVTPNSFVFTARFPRTVTHQGCLDKRIEDARLFTQVMQGMKEKLGPLLLQFPRSFKPDQWSTLEKIIASLPDSFRYVVEIRNHQWLTEDFCRFLKDRNLALCLADYPGMPRITVRTADFQYLRFLGDEKEFTEDFSYIRKDRTESLTRWMKLIRRYNAEEVEVFAFFTNQYSGHAPSTAHCLREMLNS